MAATPATEPSANTAKSHEYILYKSLSFIGWDDVDGEAFFFDDRYVTRTSIGLHGESPLMDFTIKVNRNTSLMVIPPETIKSSRIVNVHSHQIPLIRQGKSWCALVLRLKKPIHWIMSGESFTQSTGMGVFEVLHETPQLYKLASQTKFTVYFPYAVKGKLLQAFSSAPYPQLRDHLIAAPGKKLWGIHTLILSSGRGRFNDNGVEPLPSYTPPSRSEAIQASPPQASRKRRRQATDEPDEDDENDGEHLCRGVPSSDTKSASEFELAGFGQMVDTIAKRVKDQIAQEVERLADNCLDNAIKQKLSQFHQQKTDVKAEMDKSIWLFGRTTEHADKVKSEMGAAMYDFEKEMGTMMQGFEEEQRACIDALETKLEAHQTEKLKEMLGRALQTVLDGDKCTVVFTFPDETGPSREAAT
ncbi:unnamed protein product [Clonostachys rhizophaga]|uniref:Uncharacterized protein n=1 Tax=Clonostachys rhizophaga TaxID=160324 RepID=A0A9N9VIP9_9HYPO|nr:unnamed protein product [Clonostachys rhizophaga]